MVTHFEKGRMVIKVSIGSRRPDKLGKITNSHAPVLVKSSEDQDAYCRLEDMRGSGETRLCPQSYRELDETTPRAYYYIIKKLATFNPKPQLTIKEDE